MRLAPLLLVGCMPRGGPEAGDDLVVVAADAVPVAVTSAKVACDADESFWTFTVETTGWTGGGWVWLADGTNDADGTPYVEKFRMPSVGAARDGSTDSLALEVNVKVDFRDVGQGTVFPCSADPTGLLLVAAPSGEIVDCRGFGPDPELWAEIGEGGCGTPL